MEEKKNNEEIRFAIEVDGETQYLTEKEVQKYVNGIKEDLQETRELVKYWNKAYEKEFLYYKEACRCLQTITDAAIHISKPHTDNLAERV